MFGLFPSRRQHKYDIAVLRKLVEIYSFDRIQTILRHELSVQRWFGRRGRVSIVDAGSDTQRYQSLEGGLRDTSKTYEAHRSGRRNRRRAQLWSTEAKWGPRAV